MIHHAGVWDLPETTGLEWDVRIVAIAEIVHENVEIPWADAGNKKCKKARL